MFYTYNLKTLKVKSELLPSELFKIEFFLVLFFFKKTSFGVNDVYSKPT